MGKAGGKTALLVVLAGGRVDDLVSCHAAAADHAHIEPAVLGISLGDLGRGRMA